MKQQAIKRRIVTGTPIEMADLLHRSLIKKIQGKLVQLGLAEQEGNQLVRELCQLSDLIIDSYLAQ